MTKKETHISVLVVTKDKLQAMAKKQRRSMRAVIKKLIDEAYTKDSK